MWASEKKTAPAVLAHPGARTTGRQPYGQKSLLENALSDEARRTVLREAEDRYRNELMSDEERQMLLDRIKRLRRQLGLVV